MLWKKEKEKGEQLVPDPKHSGLLGVEKFCMGAQSEGPRAEMALAGGLLASWALLELRPFVFLILSFFLSLISLLPLIIFTTILQDVVLFHW